ncbi:hypothetical protein ACE41H_24225 [Paenibacillus enshidis]|uniref:Uncharacterized protein n=2 Tax=Paenibacillus TaxID=44249 RepID=A0ABV5B068_9BACL
MKDNPSNRVEEMLETLIKMVGENNSRLRTVEEDMSVLKEDVSVLKEDMSVLKEDVGVLKEDMREVKINVNGLIQGQERQDRILEMLSVKSLETDSYIRDFKRKL